MKKFWTATNPPFGKGRDLRITDSTKSYLNARKEDGKLGNMPKSFV